MKFNLQQKYRVKLFFAVKAQGCITVPVGFCLLYCFLPLWP